MTVLDSFTVVVVPGLRDHVAEHWQTLLLQNLQLKNQPVIAVDPLGRENLSCAERVLALEAAVGRIHGPVILVAHSGGVITVAHWAVQTARTVHSALLVAPPDFEIPLPAGYPSLAELDAGGWLPVPRKRLPFRSLVCTSQNDPLAAMDKAQSLAADWGSRVLDLGAVGHVNPASGFGPWPRAEELLAALASDGA